jgi:MtaA/CmuA family methyltransferase
MPYANLMQDVRACMNLRRPSRIPFFACSEEFDVKTVPDITYEQYCQSADLMVRVQKKVMREYDYDWAWLQVDDCIEFEPLGIGVKGQGNILRATCGYLPARPETLAKLHMPDPARDGRMPALLEAIRRLRAEYRDTACICGRVAAPFSTVTLLFGIEDALLLLGDEGFLRDALAWSADMQIRFAVAQVKAGAHAIWLGDCNASTHIISPATYRRFALAEARRVVEAIQAAGGLVICHNSEEKPEGLQAQAEQGVNALSCGPGIDLEEARKAVGDRVCLVGNIDPIRALQLGTPEMIRQEVKRLMAIGRRCKGYLFNSGEMIPRDTPQANMAALRDAVREYGA